MKVKINKNSKFLTPNFIPEINKHEMDIQKTYILRPGRQMHSCRTQFLVLMSADILAKLHPII